MDTAICRHLRTKKMFIPAQADEVMPPHDPWATKASAHYWCNCTLTETGADDRPVHPERCQPGRSCFRE
jgi:hypothetical protein